MICIEKMYLNEYYIA